MKFTEKDINYIVESCVRTLINEKHGAIDDSVLQLANFILEKYDYLKDIKKEECFEFMVSVDILKKFVPYFKNINVKPLPVVFETPEMNPNIEDSYAAYDGEEKNIHINIEEYNKRGMSAFKSLHAEILMHELTHYINDTVSPNGLKGYTEFPNKDEINYTANIIRYLFSDTEMQARLSQYKTWLDNNPQETAHVKFVGPPLHLDVMKDLIDKITDTYVLPDFLDSLLGHDLILKTLVAISGKENYNDLHYFVYLTNPRSEEDRTKRYWILRRKILVYLTKRYNKFLLKARKILADKKGIR